MDKTLIFLHGFGVRGRFWNGFTDYFATPAGGSFTRIVAPDLQTTDINTLVETTTELVQSEAERNGGVCLVGHSLGGAVAAVVASRLGDDLVRRLVCISSPFGTNRSRLTGVIRLLIRHHLIPEFAIRSRFYSKQTPKEIQKRMFSEVVAETPALLDAVLAETQFHTTVLTHRLSQPSLVMASEADKVVPVAQSKALAGAIGAELSIFTASERVAHDDMIAAPAVRIRAQQILGDFLRRRQA
ncbi:MAG TPA: alpha/beta hydrolase [Spirochaetia bacterium]|nr:alpha/beta hydrolase [Spirochaetia bacterium]